MLKKISILVVLFTILLATLPRQAIAQQYNCPEAKYYGPFHFPFTSTGEEMEPSAATGDPMCRIVFNNGLEGKKPASEIEAMLVFNETGELFTYGTVAELLYDASISGNLAEFTLTKTATRSGEAQEVQLDLGYTFWSWWVTENTKEWQYRPIITLDDATFVVEPTGEYQLVDFSCPQLTVAANPPYNEEITLTGEGYIVADWFMCNDGPDHAWPVRRIASLIALSLSDGPGKIVGVQKVSYRLDQNIQGYELDLENFSSDTPNLPAEIELLEEPTGWIPVSMPYYGYISGLAELPTWMSGDFAITVIPYLGTVVLDYQETIE